MRTVMVLGAGFMGSGIAQQCATYGFRVYLYDISMELAEKALLKTGWNIGRIAAESGYRNVKTFEITPANAVVNATAYANQPFNAISISVRQQTS